MYHDQFPGKNPAHFPAIEPETEDVNSPINMTVSKTNESADVDTAKSPTNEEKTEPTTERAMSEEKSASTPESFQQHIAEVFKHSISITDIPKTSGKETPIIHDPDVHCPKPKNRFKAKALLNHKEHTPSSSTSSGIELTHKAENGQKQAPTDYLAPYLSTGFDINEFAIEARCSSAVAFHDARAAALAPTNAPTTYLPSQMHPEEYQHRQFSPNVPATTTETQVAAPGYGDSIPPHMQYQGTPATNAPNPPEARKYIPPHMRNMPTAIIASNPHSYGGQYIPPHMRYQTNPSADAAQNPALANTPASTATTSWATPALDASQNVVNTQTTREPVHAKLDGTTSPKKRRLVPNVSAIARMLKHDLGIKRKENL